ncbi:MAG: hypothetical protein A2Y82_01575 [Candidatus Buchananbacteria bacterium RBG_13_36_9]|uniref:Uncharacterized protein n=1 Tax=Candidatus Buchananbacteria bacterium RBG_13_36_9 TaxID=1797530 RepID=A0A1G1XM42_9BACT|nr:MAG: hypothetical protein A2Y82_01575 [Candidatus Buchananbacteria bacterium RBG_13_36_9]
MDTLPFSIYVDKRPIRIAFLVDKNCEKEVIDNILKYNHGKWGGRFNPIIITDGKEIDEVSWNFLLKFDPDIIESFIEISEELQKRIKIFFSPYSVETNSNNNYVQLNEQPVSILPTAENVARVSRASFGEPAKIVIFKFNETTPEIIKQFINRNFGALSAGFHTEKALSECQQKIFEISDYTTLNQALLDLGESRNRFVYLSQICSLPNTSLDVEYNSNNSKFEVIVGESVQDLVYFWNRNQTISHWMRTDITQIWLTKEFAENELIKPGLQKWLNRYTGMIGNEHEKGTNFVSFSITKTELDNICSNLGAQSWHTRSANKLETMPMPNFRERSLFLINKQGLDMYRAYSNQEYVVLNEPSVQQGFMAGESWIADLYIQFKQEAFSSIRGVDYWLLLPQRNSLLNDLRMFNKRNRINAFNSFSIMLRRNTDIHPDENILEIKLPEDKSIFRSLICGEKFDCISKNEEDKFKSRPFYHAEHSDKGKYLKGVISLFEDLSSAYFLFEDNFWRRIFEMMSNKNFLNDEKTEKIIFNKLKEKIISGMDFKNSDNNLKWLSGYVMNLSKKEAKSEIHYCFQDYKKEAEAELIEFNKSRQPDSQFSFNESDLKDDLSDLVKQNILLTGFKPKCPYCGSRIWYHINNVHQQIKCRGCGYKFSLPSEEYWYYTLNTLLKKAIQFHGTIPVLLVLGQLLSDARSSFLYNASFDLFKNKGEKTCGDLDIVCIQDGKFILGEVKQKNCDFKKADFDKMAEFAELLRPDELIFSSMDLEPNQICIDGIDDLKRRLSNLNIKVRWYRLHGMSEPSPVR